MGLNNSDKTSKVFFVLIFAVFYQILFFLYRSGIVIQSFIKIVDDFDLYTP